MGSLPLVVGANGDGLFGGGAAVGLETNLNVGDRDLTGDLSLFFAFKPDGLADGAGLWDHFNTVAGTGLEARYNTGAGADTKLLAGDGTNSATTGNVITDATFHTACFVQSSNKGQWYVDGVASGVEQDPFTAVSNGRDALIGYSRVTGVYFSGRFYEVRAISRALGLGEIKALDAEARGKWA